MGLIPEEHRRSSIARRSMYLIVGMHALLLLLMIPDYFADNDLGYHISLGRQYGEHGSYFWDALNWAPTGRPNLQGPLLHYGIGIVGRLLGGEGDDYVLAFSLLAVLQWSAAIFTAIFFSRRYGGDWAALFAAALFSGAMWSAGSFFVGVPSGWIFVLTPWAIHFFLEDRYLLSALFTSAVMCVHLGGAPVAPFGVLLAAVVTRRWKGLFFVGAVTAALTSVYLFHFFEHLDWYNGRRGHVAGSFAVMTYALAAPGILWLLRRPTQNLFLLLWAVAPLAWFFQDNLRFFLQSTIVASTIAGVFLAAMLQRYAGGRWRAALGAALVLIATVYPFSIPSLPLEILYARGGIFPRELDWKEAKRLAEVMDSSGLSGRIVNSYYDSLSGAMAVYSPLSQEFGHWGEVRPAVNPARDISAGEKLYVLPLPPNDPTLRRFHDLGWVEIHGGSERTTLATLPRPAPMERAAPEAADVIHRECLWLVQNAVNNRMPPAEDLFDPSAVEEYRRTATNQRNRVGRIQVAVHVYGYAAEAVDADLARRARAMAHGWGSVANFVGDETAIDYLSHERFELFRQNARLYGQLALGLGRNPMETEDLHSHADKLFTDFFGQDERRFSRTHADQR